MLRGRTHFSGRALCSLLFQEIANFEKSIWQKSAGEVPEDARRRANGAGLFLWQFRLTFYAHLIQVSDAVKRGLDFCGGVSPDFFGPPFGPQ